MKFDTRKQKGKMGVAMAIAYFTSKGFIISIPIDDTQDYDLIIDKMGILEKVQVKASGYTERSGSYNFNLNATGGTHGGIYKTPNELDCDSFFLFCENGDMYYFPKDELKGKVSISVTSKLSKSKYVTNQKWIKFLVQI